MARAPRVNPRQPRVGNDEAATAAGAGFSEREKRCARSDFDFSDLMPRRLLSPDV